MAARPRAALRRRDAAAGGGAARGLLRFAGAQQPAPHVKLDTRRWSRGSGARCRHDLDQLGLVSQGCRAQVAQQLGHRSFDWATPVSATTSLSASAGEVDAVGQLPHQFVQQVHRHVAVGLQVFHRLLARPQRGDLLLQGGDVLDLAFELLDLGLQDRLRSAGRRSGRRTRGRCRRRSARRRRPRPQRA
jgi:hypothetical protein